MKYIWTQQVTIPAGQSLSGAFDVPDSDAIAVWLPAGWTLANVTFQVAYVPNPTASDWFDWWHDGSEVVLTGGTGGRVVTTSRPVPGITRLPQDNVAACKMRVRSGTAAAPVNQVANRVLLVSAYSRT